MIPKHIAIIMDGNGRWAKSRGMPRLAGHREGGKAADKIIHACLAEKITHLTLFAFSRENWQRPAEEVDGLMRLLARYLAQEGLKQQSLNVGLRVLGDIAALPNFVQHEIEAAKSLYPTKPDLIVNLAVNYSGQWDIAQAAKKAALDSSISEATDIETRIEQYLVTKGIPEPDLLIRTGGEMRISNFLLWQLAYTELYFTDLLWPEFDHEALRIALQTYADRERRFGRTSEQLSTTWSEAS